MLIHTPSSLSLTISLLGKAEPSFYKLVHLIGLTIKGNATNGRSVCYCLNLNGQIRLDAAPMNLGEMCKQAALAWLISTTNNCRDDDYRLDLESVPNLVTYIQEK